MNFDSVPSNRFTFIKESNTFVAELSDFREFDVLQRNDRYPCHQGFAIKSTKTGKTVDFLLWDKQYDGENELISIKFTSSCGTYKAVLFND